MTEQQNERLVRLATAMGYTVVAISPAFYGSDWGRLDLVDPVTGEEFPWNPLNHAGDRYKLIQALGMSVDFSGEYAHAKVYPPGASPLTVQFSKNDEPTETRAIFALAYNWAVMVLRNKTAGEAENPQPA